MPASATRSVWPRDEKRDPGDLVQIDTLFVNVRPDKAIKHFTAYDSVTKWTIGHVASAASASSARVLLDKLIVSAPFKVRGIQVDGGSEFMSVFEDQCRIKGLELVVLPLSRPISTAASSAPSRVGDTNSTRPTTSPIGSTGPSPSSTPSPTATTPTDPSRPWRSHPSRLSQNPQPKDPAVSYVLNQHSVLSCVAHSGIMGESGGGQWGRRYFSASRGSSSIRRWLRSECSVGPPCPIFGAGFWFWSRRSAC